MNVSGSPTGHCCFACVCFLALVSCSHAQELTPIYEQDFSEEPEFEIVSDVEGSEIGWDAEKRVFRATTVDVAEGEAIQLAYSKPFSRVTVNDTFKIVFDIRVVSPTFGQYPGIRFVFSRTKMAGKEPRGLGFHFVWTSDHQKEFCITTTTRINREYTPRLLDPTAWHTVEMLYKSGAMSMVVKDSEGKVFHHCLMSPFAFRSFDQIAVGEISRPPKYGGTTTMEMDNITVLVAEPETEQRDPILDQGLFGEPLNLP